MGNLYLVATPIGNLEDITIRAIKTLFMADYIACEDTRKTGQMMAHLYKLYNHYNVYNRMPKLISYYDEIEFKRIPEIISLLENDKNIALVSDAGTPLVSDPGFKLVRECIKRGIKIISIPGVTSFVAALTLSGLPPDQFLFLGYLPASQTKRQNLLTELLSCSKTNKQIHPTIIFFESPHRLKESLEDIKEVFGDLEIAVARELTKIHEEVWREKISEIGNTEFKGEIIILFNIPQE